MPFAAFAVAHCWLRLASGCWRCRRSGGKLNCRNYFMSNARFGKQFVTFEWPFNDNCGCLLAKSSVHSLFLRSVIDSLVLCVGIAHKILFRIGLGLGCVADLGSVGNEISALKLLVSAGCNVWEIFQIPLGIKLLRIGVLDCLLRIKYGNAHWFLDFLI